jgi:hypothetical protein
MRQQVIESVVGKPGMEPAPPLVALQVYRACPDLLPEGAARAELERRLAVKLAERGFDGAAENLLARSIGLGGSAEARAEAGAAIAAGRLAEGRAGEASETLRRSGPERGLEPALAARRAALAARAAATLGRPVALPAVATGDVGPLTDRLRAAWSAQDWPAIQGAADAATRQGGSGSTDPTVIASLALAQARLGDEPGLAEAATAFGGQDQPDSETRQLLAMLLPPRGRPAIEPGALDPDAAWLISVGDYLGRLAFTAPTGDPILSGEPGQ